MPLTRKLLEGMGLEEKQVETIIEAHVDVVNGLKAERDKAREDADKLPDLQKQLEEAVKATADGDTWKTKYDDEHEAFEKYKLDVEAKEREAEKASAYRKLLAEAGIDLKRVDAIMRVTDLKDVEMGEDGAIKDADKLKEGIEKDWGEFIVKKASEGSDPATPPANDGAKDGADPAIAERLAQRHARLYGKTETE